MSKVNLGTKYSEHVFSVIGLILCRHGLDHKLRQITNWLGDTTVAICDLSQFMIKAVTAQTESNNTENVFCVGLLGRVPMFTFDMNMKTYIFANSGVIWLAYLFVCMHISYKAHNRCTQETFLTGSDVDVNILSAFMSIPSGTIDIILKSCILNRHKLRQSQIATLPSQFVICRNLLSKPWQRKLSPTTRKTCSGYLGEYPGSLLTWIWKVVFFSHFGVISLVYMFICRFISNKAHNRCTQETFLKGSDVDVNMFSALRSIPSVSMKSIWEVVFGTVTNCNSHKCDNSGIPAVAIYDLSQFVIKAVTAQTESNNTENVFWVLGRVPRFTFDMNMKSCIFTHFGAISLVYMFVCMYISYKAHNRCTQ